MLREKDIIHYAVLQEMYSDNTSIVSPVDAPIHERRRQETYRGH
jgi:hypothetical protein